MSQFEEEATSLKAILLEWKNGFINMLDVAWQKLRKDYKLLALQVSKGGSLYIMVYEEIKIINSLMNRINTALDANNHEAIIKATNDAKWFLITDKAVAKNFKKNLINKFSEGHIYHCLYDPEANIYLQNVLLPKFYDQNANIDVNEFQLYVEKWKLILSEDTNIRDVRFVLDYIRIPDDIGDLITAYKEEKI